MKSMDDYSERLSHAKDLTVYSYSMVWIKEVLENKKLTESKQFKEIAKIIKEAEKQLIERG